MHAFHHYGECLASRSHRCNNTTMTGSGHLGQANGLIENDLHLQSLLRDVLNKGELSRVQV